MILRQIRTVFFYVFRGRHGKFPAELPGKERHIAVAAFFRDRLYSIGLSPPPQPHGGIIQTDIDKVLNGGHG